MKMAQAKLNKYIHNILPSSLLLMRCQSQGKNVPASNSSGARSVRGAYAFAFRCCLSEKVTAYTYMVVSII